jgi:hypothetical protein
MRTWRPPRRRRPQLEDVAGVLDSDREGHVDRPVRDLPVPDLDIDRAQVPIAGHAFMQNLRRGHYELAVDTPPALRAATAYTELARAT